MPRAVLLNATRNPLNRITVWQLTSLHPSCILRLQPKLRLPPKPAPLQPYNCFHNSVSRSGLYETLFHDLKPPTKVSAHVHLLQNHQEELDHLKKIDPAIYGILKEGHPDRVLHALLAPLAENLFQNASKPFFGAVFSLVDPDYFVDPFKEVYRYIKPSLINGPNEIRLVRALELQFQSFTAQLDEITQRRKKAGHELDLGVYRHLLACANALADTDMADLVWEELVSKSNDKPDLACYAHLMETKCWENSWHKSRQFSYRVTPQQERDERDRTAYGSHDASAKSLRQDIIGIFQQMVANSHIDGDENVFSCLIVAMGREGDMDGVKSILKSVWHIDVDLMRELDEEELETPLHYEADSPLRPTNRLLFVVAHVFGANNDPAMAVQLVDFLSRQYDLRIQREVWQQLFEWIYVLQRRHTTANRRHRLGDGLLNHDLFDELWTMMTGKHYRIEPDIALRAYRASTLAYAKDYDGSLRALWKARYELQTCYEMLETSINKLMNTCELLQSHDNSQMETPTASNLGENLDGPINVRSSTNTDVQKNPSFGSNAHADEEIAKSSACESEIPADIERAFNPVPASDTILPAAFFDARRSFLMRSLTFERDLQIIIVGVRRLIASTWVPRPQRAYFERRFIPEIVHRWQAYLPDEIIFRPIASQDVNGQGTGIVCLHLKPSRINALLNTWTRTREMNPELSGEFFTTTNARLRHLCQVDSHEELVRFCYTLSPKWLGKTAYTGTDWVMERWHNRREVLESWLREPRLQQYLQRLESSEKALLAKQTLGERRKQQGLDQGWIAPNRTALRGPPQPERPMLGSSSAAATQVQKPRDESTAYYTPFGNREEG